MTGIRFLSPYEVEHPQAPQVLHRRLQGIMRALTQEWRAGRLEGADLCKAWAQCGFPLSYLPARQWRAMFDETGFLDWEFDENGELAYGIPAPRPTEPLTVYRGVSASRLARRMARKYTGLDPELGWSWSTDLDEAYECAIARDPDNPAVYAADAPPEALLAFMPAYLEVVVDTSRLAAPPERVQ